MPELSNFSDRSLKVINIAEEEAHRLGHNFIGSEQLLIGLLSVDSGATQLLNAAGINLSNAQVELEKLIGRGSGFIAVQIPFTPRAKRAIEMAITRAYEQRPIVVEPKHLLLAIVDLGEGIALRLLENLGASIPQLREATLAQI